MGSNYPGCTKIPVGANFSRDAFVVAAAELARLRSRGCVRLRSSRESGCRGVPDAPKWLDFTTASQPNAASRARQMLPPNASFASCYRSH